MTAKTTDKKLTKEQKLQAERRELDILIDKGLCFEIERTVLEKQKGLKGLLGKRIPRIETLKYRIQEPTLSTLDRLSREQIELSIDENIMRSDEGLTEAKILTLKNCRRMARIVAIAVMGEDYLRQVKVRESIRYEARDKDLDNLTDLFFVNIKPSKLMQMVVLINTMGNYGDFCNSIRLMSAIRTTMPNLIENKKG